MEIGKRSNNLVARDSLGSRVNVENDLWSRRRPFQVSSHSDPQLVDVCVFPVVGGDGQGVRDGQQLQQKRADR